MEGLVVNLGGITESCGEFYKIDYTDPISRKSTLVYAGCWLETPRGMCEKLT